MKIHCTRPGCSNPENYIANFDETTTLKTEQQIFCATCGMPLMLDGRYLPQGLLAQGGFGAAFLARDRRSPGLRQCVVKQFQPSDLCPSQLETAQQLFEREAIVLDRLGSQHPQIPSLLAYFSLEAPDWGTLQHQQFFYIVQEYIEGQDLEEELEAQGQYSEDQVREILQEVLNILDFIHDQNVIHRDIKPSNIMRDRKGRLYLLDFGAVKQITQQAKTSGKSTGKSTGIYSIGYAPPEQMRGHHVFPSTDLYALAVTCIVLLTGKEPEDLFDSQTDRWYWREYTQVCDQLADILDQMLLPTPSDRFTSAQQILKALNPDFSTDQTSSNSISPPSSQLNTPQDSPAFLSLLSTGQLIRAALTGFEIGLLKIGLSSLLDSIPLVALITGGTIGGLIWAQYRQWIESKELAILVGISLALIVFIPALRLELSLTTILIISILVACIFMGTSFLFRLIYLLLKH
ncbi:MAG: serine/threonine-protein kinase [Cyanobacteria bacterium J06592_8]